MRRALAISFATLVVVAMACDEFTEGGPESNLDAGAETGAPITDTGTGGEAAVDASAPPFCSTVDATFCWSFDDDRNGSALYGPSLIPRGGPVTLTDAARSGPNALHAEGDGASGSWAVEATFFAGIRARCTVAVWLEEITNFVEVLTFDVGGRKVAFQVRPIAGTTATVQAWLLYDRNGSKVVPGLPNLPTKQWIEVTLAGERTDAGFALAASALGTAVTFDVPDAGSTLFDSFDTEVGFFAQYGGRGAVRIDDVHCTYE